MKHGGKSVQSGRGTARYTRKETRIEGSNNNNNQPPQKTDNGKLIAANRRVTDRNSTGIRKVVTGIVQNLQTIQQIKTRKDKVIDQLSYFRFIRSLSCCCCLYYYNPRMKMIQVPSNSTEWDGYLL